MAHVSQIYKWTFVPVIALCHYLIQWQLTSLTCVCITDSNSFPSFSTIHIENSMAYPTEVSDQRLTKISLADVMTWKYFLYFPLYREWEIQSLVDSLDKAPVIWTVAFSLLLAQTIYWTNTPITSYLMPIKSMVLHTILLSTVGYWPIPNEKFFSQNYNLMLTTISNNCITCIYSF